MCNKDEREQLWNSFLDTKNTLSVKTISHQMAGFNNYSCIDELKPYYEKYFASLVSVFKERAKDYAMTFY